MIDVVDLVMEYEGKLPVLNGISFSVDEGEIVTIFGKSGCGKTTLLNILGGLDRPTSGSVKIEGEEIVGESEEGLARLRLAKIGFVFQDYNLLPELTIRQNIELPLKLSRSRNYNRVQEYLERFDISHVSNEPANKVSGGEAQRAAIARAMMNSPRIILADEPTGNLDLENTNNVMSIFHGVRKDFGTTVILATHDKDLAGHATSMIALADGKAVLQRLDR